MNLITNPGFETNAAGYSVAGSYWLNAGATLTRATSQHHSGVASGKIVTTATYQSEGAFYALPDSATFIAGSSYTFTFWAKGNVGGENIYFSLGSGDGSGDFNQGFITLTSSWVAYGLTWTPVQSKSGTTGAVAITFATNTAAAVTFFVDDLYVDLIPPTPVQSSLDTLQSTQSTPPAPTLGFTVGPVGPSFTYSIGGVSYSSPNAVETFTNTPLNFTGSVTLPFGVSILEYYWNLGDGTEAYGISTTHTYLFESPETQVAFCVTDNYHRQVCIGKLINLRAGTPIVVAPYIVHG